MDHPEFPVRIDLRFLFGFSERIFLPHAADSRRGRKWLSEWDL